MSNVNVVYFLYKIADLANASTQPNSQKQIEPTDISAIPSDLLTQDFSNYTFPKNELNRSFQKQWFNTFQWLEYSKQLDSVFCYACRQFGNQSNSRTNVFVSQGFSLWNMALTKKKGLWQHNDSAEHVKAMVSWQESKLRKGDKAIVNLLNESVHKKRRYYMNSIVQIMKFLVENELTLRGNWDSELKAESGLFTSLFAYTLKIDKELKDSANSLPANLSYKSPRIQNELIACMVNAVRNEIVNDVNGSDYFTLFVDGTKDKNGVEIISIAVRYIKDGKPHESLLGFEICDDLHAEPMTNLILDSLDKYGVNMDKMICQCYDGANVMSGGVGGIQTIIQRKLGRKIPYIHCMNHRLHLVLIASIENVPMASNFFDQLRMIYNFFSRHNVKMHYEGHNILKTIDTRWSGHLRALQSIARNFKDILAALIEINSKNKFNGEDIALAKGISNVIQSVEFIFMLHFLKDLLEIIEPVNAQLQSREIGYNSALPLIENVISKIVGLKSQFKTYFEKVNELVAISEEPNAARKRKRPRYLDEYEIDGTLGERNDAKVKVEEAFNSMLEKLLHEMDKRFTENNDVLLAINSCNDMDLSTMEPLKSLGLDLPNKNELEVAKDYLEKQKTQSTESHFNILQTLYPLRNAFPTTFKLFAAVETFGSSTAISEASFSCVKRIQTVQRMSMKEQRLCNLAFLGFEYKLLNNVDNNKILDKFFEKSRKINLLQ